MILGKAAVDNTDKSTQSATGSSIFTIFEVVLWVIETVCAALSSYIQSRSSLHRPPTSSTATPSAQHSTGIASAMVRHSKNCSDRAAFTYAEKKMMKATSGSIHTRVSGDTQLKFGYCCLSLAPTASDAVVSPSGHIYSKEAIVEYLLTKTKEIKKARTIFDAQQASKAARQQQQQLAQEQAGLQSFAETQDGVTSVVKRRLEEDEVAKRYMESRKKKIDDRDVETRREEMRAMSVWMPQFVPEAVISDVLEPPRRPLSPISGDELRAKDLTPINLVKEDASCSAGGTVRFVCGVSGKAITSQKVILIKTTGAYMIEAVAQSLAYPTMICPISSKKFEMRDVLELAQCQSSFAASGNVEATKYRPGFN